MVEKLGCSGPCRLGNLVIFVSRETIVKGWDRGTIIVQGLGPRHSLRVEKVSYMLIKYINGVSIGGPGTT